MLQQPGEYSEVPNFSDVNRLMIWGLIGAFAIVVLGTLALACLGAPLPRPPAPIVRADVPGTWAYTWSGPPAGILVLRPDGTADEWWRGQRFGGNWKLDRGYLVIVTWQVGGGATYDWGWVRLSRADGVLQGDRWELKKAR